MQSRLDGIAIIVALFIAINIYYYETVISQALELRPVVKKVLE